MASDTPQAPPPYTSQNHRERFSATKRQFFNFHLTVPGQFLIPISASGALLQGSLSTLHSHLTCPLHRHPLWRKITPSRAQELAPRLLARRRRTPSRAVAARRALAKRTNSHTRTAESIMLMGQRRPLIHCRMIERSSTCESRVLLRSFHAKMYW